MAASGRASNRVALTEQLLTAVTEDGLELDGLLLQPPRGKRPSLVIWIHGFGANFYFGPYLRLAREIAVNGVAAAVVNTRGHDLATLLQPRGKAPFWGGACWEKLQESPRDLAGWVDAAVDAGFSGVVLLGHSLGAVKVTYYLAQRHDPRVIGLALASPPLRPEWDTRAYPVALEHAEQLLRNREPEALFDGPWGPVSAQTYLSLEFDQFGRATHKPSLARIDCPIFAVIGGRDADVCSADDLEVIRRNATSAARVETHVIEGADHFFTGYASEFATVLSSWVATLD
jgi:pimeloyl-ACP methyl ester carboxylesterase